MTSFGINTNYNIQNNNLPFLNNIINEKNYKFFNDSNNIINLKNKIQNINNNAILLNKNYSNLINKKEIYEENNKRNGIMDLPNFPQFLNDKKENMHKTQINKNTFNINDIISNNIINNCHLFDNNHLNYLTNNFLIPNPLLQFPNSSYLKKRPLFNSFDSLDNKFNDCLMNLRGSGI